jgi:ribosomal protein L24
MHTDLLNHPISEHDFVAVCHGAYKGTNVIKTGRVVRLTKAQVRVELSGTNNEFNYKPEKIIVINEQYKHNLSEYAEKFI